MFGKKRRIIETQLALITDLREEIENKDKVISKQQGIIFGLVEKVNALENINKATDIDFPNSEKGGSDHTGSVNVSDILNL